MKKPLSLILALAMILAAVPALADDPLAGYTTEQLQTLSTLIQAEIIRRTGSGFQLYPGTYTVGEDIPAGKYRVEVVKSYGIVSAYKADGGLVFTEFLSVMDPDDNAVIGKAILEDGMTVVIDSTSFRFVPYTGILNQ